jgi:type II secretory ATPase GspE/PulE/Tfp pilus assembly ATPase PilB-like protein
MIRKVAIETQGMNTLLVDGLKKVIKGITSLDEVMRVTGQNETRDRYD